MYSNGTLIVSSSEEKIPFDASMKSNPGANELQLTGKGTTWNHNHLRTSLGSSFIPFCIACTYKRYHLKTETKIT